jgi:hypothetical protein
MGQLKGTGFSVSMFRWRKWWCLVIDVVLKMQKHEGKGVNDPYLEITRVRLEMSLGHWFTCFNVIFRQLDLPELEHLP